MVSAGIEETLHVAEFWPNGNVAKRNKSFSFQRVEAKIVQTRKAAPQDLGKIADLLHRYFFVGFKGYAQIARELPQTAATHFKQQYASDRANGIWYTQTSYRHLKKLLNCQFSAGELKKTTYENFWAVNPMRKVEAIARGWLGIQIVLSTLRSNRRFEQRYGNNGKA